MIFKRIKCFEQAYVGDTVEDKPCLRLLLFKRVQELTIKFAPPDGCVAFKMELQINQL